jgi:hypothetical protein
MVDPPTAELKIHPPRVAPTIPTVTLRTIPSCASVRMIRLAAHPIKQPTVSQIIMFIRVVSTDWLRLEVTRLLRPSLCVGALTFRAKGSSAGARLSGRVAA